LYLIQEVSPLNYEEYDEVDEEMERQIELLMGLPKKPVRLGRRTRLSYHDSHQCVGSGSGRMRIQNSLQDPKLKF